MGNNYGQEGGGGFDPPASRQSLPTNLEPLVARFPPQQIKLADPNHGLGSGCARIAIGPVVEPESPCNSHKAALAYIIRCNLSGAIPHLNIKPVRLTVSAETIHGQSEVADHFS